MKLPESQLTKNQTLAKTIQWTGAERERHRLVITFRHDDKCGNGHNTFTVNADHDYYRAVVQGGQDVGHWEEIEGGRLDSLIARKAPQFLPFLKWHLCSVDGPMHYPGNVLFLAGDRDCWGRRKGEPSSIEPGITFGDNPIVHGFGTWTNAPFIRFLRNQAPEFNFSIVEVPHREDSPYATKFNPKYTFHLFTDRWYECPFDTYGEAERFLIALQTGKPQFVDVPTAYSQGKDRELDSARRSAIWPDATIEQLTDREILMARLPALLAELKRDVESLGFTY